VSEEGRRQIAGETFDRVVELLDAGERDEANRVLTHAAHKVTALVLFEAILDRGKAVGQ
jgi:hypothetical protein